jgi:hypothetical protein
MYRIKKHHNRNHYLHVGDNLWVRNPGVAGVPYIDINELIRVDDYPLILRNELVNNRMKYPWIDSEQFIFEDAVIVSDGHDFDEHHSKVARLPPSVAIFAVNGALAKWREKRRNPNFYIINNPYNEAMHYLPRSTFVKCIASVRTNYEFLHRYSGTKYRYYPVSDTKYCGTDPKDCSYRIDDYRNPVCAAINILHKFGVKRLLLAFCDEVFGEERPGSVIAESGKFYYPQHLKANALIDGNLFWLSRNNGCTITQTTAGPKLKTATYITQEEIPKFFQGKRG